MRALIQSFQRKSVGLVFGALALLGPTLSPVAVGAAELTPMHVGLATAQAVNIFPLYMAKDAGLFEKRGIDLDIITMDGGSSAVRILLSGDVQVLMAGLSVFARANAEGADLRLIGASSNIIRFVFFTAPKVKTAADLKGGIIGISRFGSETDIVTSIVLNRMGLSRKDVDIVQSGSASMRLASIVSGQAIGAPLNEPATSAAMELGLNPMMDLVAEHVPWLMNGIVVKHAAIKDDPDLLKRFLSAYAEGGFLAIADEARAKALMAKVYKISDQKVLDITYRDFKSQVALDVTPTPEAAENVLTQSVALGAKIGSRNVNDYIDTSLVDNLKTEGLFQSLHNQYGVP